MMMTVMMTVMMAVTMTVMMAVTMTVMALVHLIDHLIEGGRMSDSAAIRGRGGGRRRAGEG